MFKRKDPAQLAAQLQAMKQSSGFEADGKEWKLTADNAGNGTAVIRFLPGKNDESLPFVKLVNHFFKGPGKKYYSENCTSTFGDFENCPVCKHISDTDAFNTNKKLYDTIKRKTSFWCNILVIKDPAKPENDGKVFKYRFGQKIMDKINAMVEVDTEIGEVPVDVTCPFEGANFVIKVKKVGGFPNYDECKFQGQTKIKGIDNEAFQAKLAEDMFDLNTLVSPDKFNSLDKNTELFKTVMGTSIMGGAAQEAANQADALEDELDSFNSQMEEFETDTEVDKPEAKSTKVEKVEDTSDSLDDLLEDL